MTGKSFLSVKFNILLLASYAILLLSFNFVDVSGKSKIILYIVNFLICFGIYSAVYLRSKNSVINIYHVILVAALLRLCILPVEHITSDDYYRYLWDGKVQASGINPYKFAPNDPELAALHSDKLPALVNHPQIKTIYPPLSQVVFLVSFTLFGESIIGLKILYLILDIITILFLLKILQCLNLNKAGVLLYALSPLIIFEFYINAHVDILLICLLAVSVYFLSTRNFSLAFLFLGCTVAAKLYTLVLFPVFFVYLMKQDKSFKTLATSTLLFLLPAIFFIPYSGHIENMFATMNNYNTYWYFNNLIYKLPNEFLVTQGFISDPALRTALQIIFIIALIVNLISKLNIISKISLTLFSYFILSPTLHPWYITVLVFFLALEFNWTYFFWTGFIALTNFTVYNYLTSGEWKDVNAVLFLEYIILLTIFLIEYNRRNFSKPILTHTQEI